MTFDHCRKRKGSRVFSRLIICTESQLYRCNHNKMMTDSNFILRCTWTVYHTVHLCNVIAPQFSLDMQLGVVLVMIKPIEHTGNYLQLAIGYWFFNPVLWYSMYPVTVREGEKWAVFSWTPYVHSDKTSALLHRVWNRGSMACSDLNLSDIAIKYLHWDLSVFERCIWNWTQNWHL